MLNVSGDWNCWLDWFWAQITSLIVSTGKRKIGFIIYSKWMFSGWFASRLGAGVLSASGEMLKLIAWTMVSPEDQKEIKFCQTWRFSFSLRKIKVMLWLISNMCCCIKNNSIRTRAVWCPDDRIGLIFSPQAAEKNYFSVFIRTRSKTKSLNVSRWKMSWTSLHL